MWIFWRPQTEFATITNRICLLCGQRIQSECLSKSIEILNLFIAMQMSLSFGKSLFFVQYYRKSIASTVIILAIPCIYCCRSRTFSIHSRPSRCHKQVCVCVMWWLKLFLSLQKQNERVLMCGFIKCTFWFVEYMFAHCKVVLCLLTPNQLLPVLFCMYELITNGVQNSSEFWNKIKFANGKVTLCEWKWMNNVHEHCNSGCSTELLLKFIVNEIIAFISSSFAYDRSL